MIDHHGHHPAPHHPAPHHPAPHHLAPHHPAPHHPAPHHLEPHHPHQVAAVPVLMVPPTAHASHYDHPVSGYPKPAHAGSLEEIFGLHKPAYHAPEPAYHAPEPAYHAPESAYHAPEPAYHTPEPAYHAPEPAYHAPALKYHGSLDAVFGLTPKSYVTPAPLYDLPTTYKPKMPDYLTGKNPHAKSLPPPHDPGYVLPPP